MLLEYQTGFCSSSSSMGGDRGTPFTLLLWCRRWTNKDMKLLRKLTIAWAIKVYRLVKTLCPQFIKQTKKHSKWLSGEDALGLPCKTIWREEDIVCIAIVRVRPMARILYYVTVSRDWVMSCLVSVILQRMCAFPEFATRAETRNVLRMLARKPLWNRPVERSKCV
jgi:hypothetical protein